MIVKVKVFPKSKINLIECLMIDNGELSLVVRVTAVPDKGEANNNVIKMISKFLNVSQSSIALIKGHRCRQKVFRVDNVSKESLKKINNLSIKHYLLQFKKYSSNKIFHSQSFNY